VEELVGTALSLMKEGRVANPLESEVVMLSGPAAGGPEPPKPERLAAV